MTLAETYVEVLDELVQLLDRALAGADSRARYELSQRVVERAKVEIDRGRLLDEVLDILADPLVSDADAGRLVRARIGMPRLQAARRPASEREPRDHRHLDLLDARYKYMRTFTQAVVAHLPLAGNTSTLRVLNGPSLYTEVLANGPWKVKSRCRRSARRGALVWKRFGNAVSEALIVLETLWKRLV
ncbi:MAG: hypothetical protein M3069_32630 [Chloroflexota bacterium]|nr:hypothetical protein [Chloroflexota bacterium]